MEANEIMNRQLWDLNRTSGTWVVALGSVAMAKDENERLPKWQEFRNRFMGLKTSAPAEHSYLMTACWGAFGPGLGRCFLQEPGLGTL